MKLAAQLLERATQKDLVITTIKDRITNHLQGVAERGGKTATYNFVTEDLDIQNAIEKWLEAEGFITIRSSTNGISIFWNTIYAPSIIDRMMLAVDRYKAAGYHAATFKAEIGDKEEDVNAAAREMHRRGYSVRYNPMFCEATIVWKK